MKQPASVCVAAWILERTAPGRTGEALAGDLLEELGAGRSAGWYWRQVLVALGQSAASRARPYAMPLLYSVVWGLMSSGSLRGVWGRLLSGELERWSALSWPYSSLLLVTGGLLPAMCSLGAGCVVYVLAFAGTGARPSLFRLVGSLSLGLNVLFLGNIGLSCLHGATAAGPHLSMQTTVLLNAQPAIWSAPLILGLWAAIVCAVWLPRVPADRSSAA